MTEQAKEIKNILAKEESLYIHHPLRNSPLFARLLLTHCLSQSITLRAVLVPFLGHPPPLLVRDDASSSSAATKSDDFYAPLSSPLLPFCSQLANFTGTQRTLLCASPDTVAGRAVIAREHLSLFLAPHRSPARSLFGPRTDDLFVQLKTLSRNHMFSNSLFSVIISSSSRTETFFFLSLSHHPHSSPTQGDEGGGGGVGEASKQRRPRKQRKPKRQFSQFPDLLNPLNFR